MVALTDENQQQVLLAVPANGETSVLDVSKTTDDISKSSKHRVLKIYKYLSLSSSVVSGTV